MGEHIYDAWGWFGDSHNAPIEKVWPHKPVPVGRRCGGCDEPIKSDQDGYILPLASAGPVREPSYPVDIPYHRKCMSRMLGIDRLDRSSVA